MDAVWVVALAWGTLLVRAGQMLGAMGIARSKNSASAGLRSVTDLCVAVLCYWAIGAAIHFQQSNRVLGLRIGYLAGWGGLPEHWFAVLMLVLIATGVVAPAVAERSRLGVPLAASGLLAAVLVPLVGHWTWHGWLSDLKFVDFGGAAALHLNAGLCAATCAVMVGAREGKYNRDGSSNMIPGHNIPMVIIASMLMLAGWIPYLLMMAPLHGSNVSGNAIAANVILAGATGGLTSLLVGRARFGKADVLLTISGLLGGLVSVTAAADRVGTPAAFLIGLIGGLLVPWMTILIELRWKIDDPGGVVAIHGVGGIWALLAAGIFAPRLALMEHLKLIGVQLLGAVAAGGAALILSAAIMLVFKAIRGLRSREADEFDGLDLAEHDINAHPDFQQTMIKSYHLREA